MNLFAWNALTDPKLLSFILRRTYGEKLEPGIINGWIVGTNYPDMLFEVDRHNDITKFSIGADIASGLSVSDFVKLDQYHALEDGIHKRIQVPATVTRARWTTTVPVFVYVAGTKFTKIKGNRWPAKKM